MRKREEILIEILSAKGNLSHLQKEISQHSWDSEIEIVVLTKRKLLALLNKCINDEMSLDDLKIWSNLVEMRDDIGINHEKYHEYIFEFANPEINGKITKCRIQDIIKEIRSQ